MSYTHFTLEKRIILENRLRNGESISEIAKILKLSRSSIYREIRRNSSKDEFGDLRYAAKSAQKIFIKRRFLANQCHLGLVDNTPLANAIIRLLKRRWSPEQISHSLKEGRVMVGGKPYFKVQVAVQTIYDFIYRFHKELMKYLRHNNRYRHKREYYINKKKRKERQELRGIDKRPHEVEERYYFGHWEGDTVLGANNGATGRIATLVERKSGFLIAYKLDAMTEDELLMDDVDQELERITMSLKFADGAVEQMTKRIRPTYLRTLTLDNGKENNGYEWIERGIPTIRVYFAHAYHSWERGTNENTNGLLRQYFPKGMDFANVTQEDVDKAVWEINNRPRKRLDWHSPQWVARQKGILRQFRKCRNWN